MTVRLLNRILIFLGFAGIFVAGVLMLADLFGGEVPCGPSAGCESVAAWSHVHPPFNLDSFIGFGAYVVLMLMAVSMEITPVTASARIFKLGLGFSIFGALYSIGLQIFAIGFLHATCKWCLSSAIIMILTALVYLKLKAMLSDPEPPAAAANATPSVIYISTLGLMSLGGMVWIGSGIANTANTAKTVQLTSQQVQELETGNNVLNPNGKVTIVGFEDLVCPSCKAAFPLVEQIIQNSHGKVRFILHHFPLITLEEHKYALPGAFLSQIVYQKDGPKGFWSFVSACYGGDMKAPAPTIDDMLNFAKQLGIDTNAAEAELKAANPADPNLKTVLDDMDLGKSVGVTGTPTFFILAPGQPPRDCLASALASTLALPQYTAIMKG